MLHEGHPAFHSADVRRFDIVDFLFAALVSVLLYLVAAYVGTFGSWDQYFAAFVAGATGSFAVNWALLPWARSYGSSSPQQSPAIKG